MIPLLLTIVFTIHLLAFLWMYIKKRRLRDIFFVCAFILLTAAYAITSLGVMITVPISTMDIELPVLLKLIGLIPSAIALYLFIVERRNKEVTGVGR